MKPDSQVISSSPSFKSSPANTECKPKFCSQAQKPWQEFAGFHSHQGFDLREFSWQKTAEASLLACLNLPVCIKHGIGRGSGEILRCMGAASLSLPELCEIFISTGAHSLPAPLLRLNETARSPILGSGSFSPGLWRVHWVPSCPLMQFSLSLPSRASIAALAVLSMTLLYREDTHVLLDCSRNEHD